MMLLSKMAAFGHYMSVTSLLMLAAIGYFYSKQLHSPAGVHMQVKVFSADGRLEMEEMGDGETALTKKTSSANQQPHIQHSANQQQANNDWPAPPSDVTKILVSAYYRSGSTFISDMLQQLHNDTFFIFEPFYSIYAHWYGTPAYHEVLYTADGRPRGLPPGEREQLVKMTSEMFECNFDNIPAEFFLSSFHFTYPTSREASYTQCIRNSGILSESHDVCRAGLGICKPTTFLRQDISEFCYKAKQTSTDNHAEYLNSPQFSDPRRSNLFQHMRMQMATYTNCTRVMYEAIAGCLSLLRHECLAAKVRVIKTIRLSVDLVHKVATLTPDLKVVHLVRDPRAMFHSRRDWVKVSPEQVRVTCARLIDDVTAGQRMAVAMPTRYMRVRYEDLVTSPEPTALRLFRHVGAAPPREHFARWLHNHTNASEDNAAAGTIRANAHIHADLWRSDVSVITLVTSHASQQCLDAIRKLGYVA